MLAWRPFMAAPKQPIIETCTACGALIDVAGTEPFALMHCAACGAAQRVRRHFDSFELTELLGAGGMGAVYRAMDKNLTRFVAIKLLRPELSNDQEFVRQLQKEAAITASINHPNVVKVYTAGQDNGLVYIAMELVDKGSLDELMTLQGRVPETQALEVGVQIARGLDAALQRGLIHRDVKPGNILFADARTSKIVDFGLAVPQDQAGTLAGEVWGTPYYVAPEKLSNDAEDFRSDLYSLGATLFHAIAGRPPFEAETSSMKALLRLKAQVVSLQSVAPEVCSETAFVINKAMAFNPKERYQSYQEFIKHLEYARTAAAAMALQGGSRKTGVLATGESGSKALNWIVSALVALAVLGAVALFSKREWLARPAPASNTPVPSAITEPPRLEPRFKAGRDLLLARKFEQAAGHFAELAAQPSVPQPLLNWVSLHQGLAELLSGNDEKARPCFSEIENRGLYSRDPAEQKMARFFIETSHQLGSASAAAPSLARNYDKDSHEAIALLLFALKDWQLGKYDDAATLLRQFQASSPQSPYTWVGEYKTLAEPLLEQFDIYQEATQAIRAALRIEQQRDALKSGKALREKLSEAGSPLGEELTPLLAELENKIGSAERAEDEKAAAQTEAETRQLAALRKQYDALFQLMRYSDARQLAAGAGVTNETARRELALMIKKAEWMSRFKAVLINDINNSGYPKSITRRTGQAIPGNPVRANEQGLEVRSTYGSLPVLWSDLSADTILQLSRHFIRPTLPAEIAADRRWYSGVFACLSGKEREGRELLAEAAQGKPSYLDEIPLLVPAGSLPLPAPTPTPPPAAKPTPPPTPEPPVGRNPKDDL